MERIILEVTRDELNELHYLAVKHKHLLMHKIDMAQFNPPEQEAIQEKLNSHLNLLNNLSNTISLKNEVA